jgi:predicted ATPase
MKNLAWNAEFLQHRQIALKMCKSVQRRGMGLSIALEVFVMKKWGFIGIKGRKAREKVRDGGICRYNRHYSNYTGCSIEVDSEPVTAIFHRVADALTSQ